MKKLTSEQQENANRNIKTDSLRLFNEYVNKFSESVRFLIKSIFIFSGGALTLSTTLYINNPHIAQKIEAVNYIKASWVMLFVSIASGLSLLFLYLVRDSSFIEKWRLEFTKQTPNILLNFPDAFEHTLWALGVISMLTFLCGLWLLIEAAAIVIT